MDKNIYRTHSCGELKLKDIDSEVVLSGWVESVRDHGGVLFLDLRDMYGVTQCVSNDDSMFTHIPKESVVTIYGVVRKRSEDTYNDRIPTGEVEVLASSLDVITLAKPELPFEIMSSKNVDENLRLKYRYLDLRNSKVLDGIKFRTDLIDYLRSLMKKMEFMEIQTPILTSSSPEGAREFIIPSRKFQGKFYVLPQAPQIFKQLLMVGGIDRYFQIAPCFRDEDARKDRLYGEFYQLDFEMSFATEEDVYKVGEKIFSDVFNHFGSKKVSKSPFRRITYKEAMAKYGSDKPDLRNPLVIEDLSELFENSEFKPFNHKYVRCISVPDIALKSNSWFNDIVDYASSIGMPGIGYLSFMEDGSFKGPIDKFLSDDDRKYIIDKLSLKKNSVVFFIANRIERHASLQAGSMRDYIGKKAGLLKDTYEFCIVNDMPFYEYNEDTKSYEFGHNPFSMPQGGLDALNSDDLGSILAYQYDFVCNGVELSSGAVRNHDINIMKKAFALAGYDEEVVESKFGALYEAFQYGAPPHAGMAPGIDRMIMLLRDDDSVRESVAFPKTSGGEDLLMQSPNVVSEEQLRETHIKCR